MKVGEQKTDARGDPELSYHGDDPRESPLSNNNTPKQIVLKLCLNLTDVKPVDQLKIFMYYVDITLHF